MLIFHCKQVIKATLRDVPIPLVVLYSCGLEVVTVLFVWHSVPLDYPRSQASIQIFYGSEINLGTWNVCSEVRGVVTSYNT